MPGGVISQHIQTGAIIKLIEDNLNNWEDFAGSDIVGDVSYWTPPTVSPFDYSIDWWGYRGQAALCARTTDGALVRVRIGDGSTADRRLYRQIITDPTNTGQWTTWSLLYSGTWYAVAIYPDSGAAAGYRVVHSSATAIFVDNVSKITVSNVIKLRPIRGYTGRLYYGVLDQNSGDNKRVIDFFHTTNIVAGTAGTADLFNYEWAHNDLAAIGSSAANGVVSVARACPYFANNSRSQSDSDALLYHSEDNADYLTSIYDGIHVLRGASGRAGVKNFNELYLTANLDDNTYLFYTEEHRDRFSTNSLSNLRRPLMWSRAATWTDSLSGGWSEPTPVGYSVWGFAGVELWGGYIYAAGNGRVLRRPVSATEIDLSNYVLDGDLNSPRENQKGTGSITLANPDNVVGDLLGMAANELSSAPEKRIDIQLGQQTFLDEGYDYARTNDWWVAGITRDRDKKAGRNHLVLKVEDFWHRLDNKFRDVYYFPGRFDKTDWLSEGDADNLTSNYFSVKGVPLTRSTYTAGDDTLYRMNVPSGKVLYTPWKGHSLEYFYVYFNLISSGHAATYLIFRWKDSRNYYRVKYQTSTLTLQEVRNGKVTDLTSAAAGATSQVSFGISVQAYFNRIVVQFNYVTKITHTIATYRRFSGHVGAWSASDNWKMERLIITDVEAETLTSDLIKAAMAHAGYLTLDIAADLTDDDQLDTIWGPQTDVESPVVAMQRLSESNHLQVICKWNGEVPTIYVDQFTGTDPDYSITDEIIEYAQVEAAERRINVSMVDGNENSWTEYYRPDLLKRGKTVNEYMDLPELMTQAAVTARAGEVLDNSLRSNSPGGTVVYRTYFQRMDVVSWTDEFGDVWAMRIEGLHVQWNQGKSPFQRAIIDGGPVFLCEGEEVVDIASDSFTRELSGSWGTADLGGAWTVGGTAARWDVSEGVGTVNPVAGTDYSAILGSTNIKDVTVKFKTSNDKDFLRGQQNTGVLLRYVDANNFVHCYLQLLTSGAMNLRLRKHVAGVSTVVATVSVSDLDLEARGEFKLQVQAEGTTFRAKVWKSADSEPSEYRLEAIIDDAALQVSDAIGLSVFLEAGAASDPATWTIDDFEAW